MILDRCAEYAADLIGYGYRPHEVRREVMARFAVDLGTAFVAYEIGGCVYESRRAVKATR